MLKAVVLLCVVALATCVYGFVDYGFAYREVDDEDVVAAANCAAKSVSEKLGGDYHHRLRKVKQAASLQSVKYKLTIFVGKTTCKKDEVKFENASNCEFQDRISTYKICITRVNRNLVGSYKTEQFGCILANKNEI